MAAQIPINVMTADKTQTDLLNMRYPATVGQHPVASTNWEYKPMDPVDAAHR
jgi:hypothetical protein